MSWARIDDKFFLNPKVVVLDKDAKLLYIAGLTYCAGGLTDGHIPCEVLLLLGSMAGIANAQASAERLLSVCLWAGTESGYFVHDYLDYNPTRDRVLATREARQNAGSKGGKASLGRPRKQLLEPLLVSSSKQKAQQTPSTIPSHTPITSIDKSIEAAHPKIPAIPKAKAPNLAPLVDAFRVLGLPDPPFERGEGKAAQSILKQHFTPEEVAQCWQDHATGDYGDGFSQRDLSFDYLATRQRVANWKRWTENGRAGNSPRVNANGQGPPPDVDNIPFAEVPANWRGRDETNRLGGAPNQDGGQLPDVGGLPYAGLRERNTL